MCAEREESCRQRYAKPLATLARRENGLHQLLAASSERFLPEFGVPARLPVAENVCTLLQRKRCAVVVLAPDQRNKRRERARERARVRERAESKASKFKFTLAQLR